MKYLIPLIVIILLIRYLVKKRNTPVPRSKVQPEVLKQDPVCGAYVPQQQELSLRTQDGPKYFCSKACMEKFRELRQ